MIIGPIDLQGQHTCDGGCVCVRTHVNSLSLAPIMGAVNSLVEQRRTFRMANILTRGHTVLAFAYTKTRRRTHMEPGSSKSSQIGLHFFYLCPLSLILVDYNVINRGFKFN